LYEGSCRGGQGAALLEKGADVDANNNDVYIPLHCACYNRYCDIAAMLRAKGMVELAKDAECGLVQAAHAYRNVDSKCTTLTCEKGLDWRYTIPEE
jgi:ankyrin repeat protein